MMKGLASLNTLIETLSVIKKISIIKRLSLLMLMSAVMSSGCTVIKVEPWERGNLANPMMTNPDPILTGMRDHVHFSKEGSHGSASRGGGGCGCN